MTVVVTVRATTVSYAGLVTRTLAFAMDAVIINVVAFGTGIVIALGLSLISLPDEVTTLLTAIGAVLACAWAIAYFVFFWSATGQTPGNRVMRIVVLDASTGHPVHAGRAVLRLLCLPLAAIPLCAGFLMILFDDRRRALQDRLARTVVEHVREEPPAAHPSDVRTDA
jgi:uncharacterized RDD family membrane protein YckC